MKISSQQYAQLIWQLSQEAGASGLSEGQLAELVHVIKKNRDQDKLEEIERDLERLELKKQGFLEVVIESAQELVGEDLAQVKGLLVIRERVEEEKVILKNRVNPSLKGGFILRWKGNVLDASVQGRVRKLSEVIKAS